MRAKLATLHYAAVKAAQAYEAATPGTRAKEAKWIAWSKLEKKFTEALGAAYGEPGPSAYLRGPQDPEFKNRA